MIGYFSKTVGVFGSSSHGHRLALLHSIHLAVLSCASRPTLFLTPAPQLPNSPSFLLAMTETGNDPTLLTVPQTTCYSRPVSRNSARGCSPSSSTLSLASSQQHPTPRSRRPHSTQAPVSVSGGPYSRPQTAYATITSTSSFHSLGLNQRNSSRVSISSTLTRNSVASPYAIHVQGSETATSDHLSATDVGGDIAKLTHDTASLNNTNEEIILRLDCITPTMTEDKKYTPPRL